MSRKPHILATFERKAAVLDAFIGQTDEWQEVARAWISVEHVSAREYVEAAQVTAQHKLLVKTAWTTTLGTVDAACRMTFDGRVFEIEQITNVAEQNRQLQLIVMERV